MDRRKKNTIVNIIVIMVITFVAILAMINLKDWVNREEGMRAMEQLGQKILQLRKENGSVPSETYVKSISGEVEGFVRLGNLQYRGRWINPECTADEVLAYTKRNYHSLLLCEGYIVLRLGGQVEWIDKKQFETLLVRQQSPVEIQLTDKSP